MKEELKSKIPFNLQFFAESGSEENQESNLDSAQEKNQESVHEPELGAEEKLQQALIEIAKLKKATDKASSEAAEYKKKWKSAMTEQEKADMEKAEKEAERQEQFNQLLKENSVNKLEKNFLALGYSPEKAKVAAEAQYENDTESLFKIQSEHQAEILKQKEAEWLKNRPAPQGGNEDDSKKDPFLEGFNSK